MVWRIKLPFFMDNHLPYFQSFQHFIRDRQSLASILILLAGLGWIWITADREGILEQAQKPLPRQGFSAPDFSLNSLEGEAIRLSDLRGQPVVINFWASWCQPCRREMPAIERAYLQYRSQDLVVLAINATSQDNLTEVQDFVAALGITFPILLDPQGEVMSLYQVSALPTTFFIGADGVIQDVVIGGPMAEALITSRMKRLVESK